MGPITALLKAADSLEKHESALQHSCHFFERIESEIKIWIEGFLQVEGNQEGLVKNSLLRLAEHPDKVREGCFGQANQLVTMDAALMLYTFLGANGHLGSQAIMPGIYGSANHRREF